MANYLFEQMSDQDALGYNPTTDDLFFLTGSPATVGVQYNAAAGLSNASITLTNGTISHTFVADALAGEHLTFFGASSDDTLAFGHDSSADTVTVAGVADAGARYFGLGGADVITGSAASDTIYGGLGDDTINGSSTTTETDYLNGGAGADSITGGNGNDHIYGNDVTTTAGVTDGADHLDGGNGNDYIQGNAGADTIIGGEGNDRLYGGADADSISGGNGYDYLQGNKGADSLDGGANNDTIHGGADNDTLLGGDGNDQLFGDNGNDSISGGNGFDQLWGGDGNDTFSFAGSSDALDTNIRSAATATGHGTVETINDFQDGNDLIHLGTNPAADANILHTATGVTFTDANAAETYAQQLVTTAGTGNVAAITVGADTYLFYSAAGTSTLDSAIKIVGVTDSHITHADFV